MVSGVSCSIASLWKKPLFHRSMEKKGMKQTVTAKTRANMKKQFPAGARTRKVYSGTWSRLENPTSKTPKFSNLRVLRNFSTITSCCRGNYLTFSLFDNSNSKISVMKQALRLCRTGCGRRVSTARSFLCRICFRKQAVSSGSRSSGNKCPIRPGNSSAKGTLGNAGNRVRGKSKKIAGRAGRM